MLPSTLTRKKCNTRQRPRTVQEAGESGRQIGVELALYGQGGASRVGLRVLIRVVVVQLHLHLPLEGLHAGSEPLRRVPLDELHWVARQCFRLLLLQLPRPALAPHIRALTRPHKRAAGLYYRL